MYMYCTDCTGYYLPAAALAVSITYHAPRLTGQLTLPANLASQLLYRCVNPVSSTLKAAAAYSLLNHCVNMVSVATVPIAPEHLVATLMRDSLFVDFGDDGGGGGQGRMSWAMHFGMTSQLGGQNKASNAVGSAAVAGAGVSVGAGIASMSGF